MIDENMRDVLIRHAMEARGRAYCPYSKYAVGAALMSENGEIYEGCNIENASYGGTVCAERVAIFGAVSEGIRNFLAIAIVGGPAGSGSEGAAENGFAVPDTEPFAWPCGFCRQVMREFCDPESFQIVVARNPEDYRVCTLAQLLPESFGPENLGK